MKRPTIQEEKTIKNLRRIFRELRRQFGPNEILLEDFKEATEQILTNCNYSGPLDEDFFNKQIFC